MNKKVEMSEKTVPAWMVGVLARTAHLNRGPRMPVNRLPPAPRQDGYSGGRIMSDGSIWRED